MYIFLLFAPEAALTSRFLTATFLYNRFFPGHKAEGSHNPYYTAADSHIFLPAHMEAGRDKTAALAAVAGTGFGGFGGLSFCSSTRTRMISSPI